MAINGLNMYNYAVNNPITVNAYTEPVVKKYGVGTIAIIPMFHDYNFRTLPSTFDARVGVFNRYSNSGEFRNGLLYGKGAWTFLYASSQFRFQGSHNKKGDKAQIGYFAKVSIFNANGQIGFGNENLGISLIGVVDVGTSNLFVGYMETDSGWFFGVRAEASVATARIGTRFDLGGLGVEVGGSAKFLTTGEFRFGFGSDGFEFGFGTSGLFGLGFYIRITW